MNNGKDGIKIHIHPKGEFDNIDDSERLKLSELITSFLERYKNLSQEFDVNIELKKHKEKIRAIPQYYCHLTVGMDSGKFHSESKGIGTYQAIHHCIEQLSKQISKKIGKIREHPTTTRNRDPFKMS